MEAIKNECNKVGPKVKAARKARNLTLKQLSEKTGLSIGYLSNLERDVSSPTLENIQSVCAAMEISLVNLLSGTHEHNVIIKKNNRELLLDKPQGIRYESINYGDDKLSGLYINIQPHQKYTKTWTHNYDEIGFIISGQMEMRIDDQTFTLETGDSFYIKAHTEHSLSNPFESPCESYWVK